MTGVLTNLFSVSSMLSCKRLPSPKTQREQYRRLDSVDLFWPSILSGSPLEE